MLDAAAQDEAVAGFAFELLVAASEAQVTRDHVDQLIVRMGMPGALPSHLHAMLDEHHVLVVREDAPLEARLRRKGAGFAGANAHDVGKGGRRAHRADSLALGRADAQVHSAGWTI